MLLESAFNLDSRAENKPAARVARVGLRRPVKCAASARYDTTTITITPSKPLINPASAGVNFIEFKCSAGKLGVYSLKVAGGDTAVSFVIGVP